MTFGSSQIGRAFQGSDKLLNTGKTPKELSFFPLGFSEASSVLIPVDSLWAISVPWLGGSREKGGTRVTASSQMEPQAQTGLSPRPHFPPSLQPRTLQMQKRLLAQGCTQVDTQ